MNEIIARQLMTERYAQFNNLHPAVQEATIAGFIFGYETAMDQAKAIASAQAAAAGMLGLAMGVTMGKGKGGDK